MKPWKKITESFCKRKIRFSVIVGAIFLGLLLLMFSYSYALFTISKERENAFQVIAGNLYYRLSSNAFQEENEILVPANTEMDIELTLESLNSISSEYHLYYETVLPYDVTINYVSDYQKPSDQIGIAATADGKKTIVLHINNRSDQELVLPIGVSGGLLDKNFTLDEGKYAIVDSYYANKVVDFAYTGEQQEFIVTESGYYKIELWGASGGDFDEFTGGKGAYTSGTIYLEKGEVLYFYVGGAGVEGTLAGGYNGGGNADILYGSAGGGATDVRLIDGAWNNSASLASRIMVAAGGGGANNRNQWGDCGYGAGNGGNGGTVVGSDGSTTNHTINNCTYGWNIGTGGRQKEGGLQITYNSEGEEIKRSATASFGIGSSGQSGGGGGYYGGGYSGHGGAGGGSSYVSGAFQAIAVTSETDITPKVETYSQMSDSFHYSGKIFENIHMYFGNWNMPSYTSEQTMVGGNVGNGYARISLITDHGYQPVVRERLEAEFSVPGIRYAYVVPKDGKYKIQLWGAKGGDKNAYQGGAGAYTEGVISLTKDDILYFHVGGTVSTSRDWIGGYNGGGSVTYNQSGYGSPGGGATDVRLHSGPWYELASLQSRIMVAAGGGGADNRGEGYGDGHGGYAGGLIGGEGTIENATNGYGYTLGAGGTQTSGGFSYEHPGTVLPGKTYLSASFGMGILYQESFDIDSGSVLQSSGGGGYYGGGNGGHGGAGGGSSFISGYPGCDALDKNGNHTGQSNHYSGKVFTNYQMKAGNEEMILPDNTTGIGNDAQGYARITFVEG